MWPPTLTPRLIVAQSRRLPWSHSSSQAFTSLAWNMQTLYPWPCSHLVSRCVIDSHFLALRAHTSFVFREAKCYVEFTGVCVGCKEKCKQFNRCSVGSINKSLCCQRVCVFEWLDLRRRWPHVMIPGKNVPAITQRNYLITSSQCSDQCPTESMW